MDNRKVIWSPSGTSQQLAMNCPANILLLGGTRGSGKDIELSTPVLTDSGWKKAGDITHSDKLVGDNGEYCDIEGIFPIHGNQMYAIEFSNGTIIEAGLEHRWKASHNNLDWAVFTTKDLLNNIGMYVPMFKNPILKNNKWEFEKTSVTVVSVTPTTITNSVCFSVNNESHCFVIKDFIISHNTDLAIMKWRSLVGLGYGRYHRGLAVDLQLSSLDDIISKCKKYFFQFEDGCKFLASKGENKFVWKTGEELLFRAVSCKEDYDKLHGSEFSFITINELTKHPTSDVFDMLLSLNRHSFIPEYNPLPDGSLLPPLSPMMLCTTNPYSVGKRWVKERFVDVGNPGEIIKRETKIFNPQTGKDEVIVKTQCYIFSSWRENKFLSKEYIADLMNEPNEARRKAWLLGDWDSDDDEGAMFADLWCYDTHVMKPFAIPDSWKIYRSYDHGEAKPFSVGWHAISDGCDVELHDGRTISTVRGDIFRIAEWYGCEVGKRNVGLRMLASDIAKGIIEREISLGVYGKVIPGAADNAIWTVENGNSVAASMMKPVRLDDGRTVAGVTWARSDKGSGSRVAGWSNMRKHLAGAIKPLSGVRENAGLFVFNTCNDFISLIGTIPRDKKNPDDIDTNSEDHIVDECRYMILSTATGARSGKTVGLG